MIKYPLPLKKGDTIGITATSLGVTGAFSIKLSNAIKNIEALGYKCIETASVRKVKKLVSNTADERVKEFMALYLNEDVKMIIPPWGGQFLMDILPLLDYEILSKATPKWIMGFSDTSSLMFALTTRLNIATAHGPNALDFGCEPVDETVYESLKLLSLDANNLLEQHSSALYQKDWADIHINNFAPYQLTEHTKWQSKEDTHFEGRLIGGCLDIICKLVGTPFAPVKSFLDTNNEKGFIWYFESCDMDVTDIYRTLLQFKLNGWFENCKGILYGRLEGYSDMDDFTFTDIFEMLFVDIPVIYDVDIGHVPPQLTLINGAFTQVSLKEGRGTVKQQLI